MGTIQSGYGYSQTYLYLKWILALGMDLTHTEISETAILHASAEILFL